MLQVATPLWRLHALVVNPGQNSQSRGHQETAVGDSKPGIAPMRLLNRNKQPQDHQEGRAPFTMVAIISPDWLLIKPSRPQQVRKTGRQRKASANPTGRKNAIRSGEGKPETALRKRCGVAFRILSMKAEQSQDGIPRPATSGSVGQLIQSCSA